MKIPIVKDHRPAVGARLNIDLDGKAALDRLVYGTQASFRDESRYEVRDGQWG